jgi:hypothetical protein
MSRAAPGGPIAEATAGLATWLADTTGVAVVTGPPLPKESARSALVLWPLELRPERATVGVGVREPFRFRVRHLVLPGGPPDAAADVLDRILVAAVAAGEPTVVLEPPEPQLWLALATAPRLALLLDVAAAVVPPTPRQPLVRVPLRVEARPVRPLHGRVVGPGGAPLAGVRVQLTGTGAVTHTDAAGQFSFAAAPAGERAHLRLRVKQHSLSAEVGTPSPEPVVIHCDAKEV